MLALVIALISAVFSAYQLLQDKIVWGLWVAIAAFILVEVLNLAYESAKSRFGRAAEIAAVLLGLGVLVLVGIILFAPSFTPICCGPVDPELQLHYKLKDIVTVGVGCSSPLKLSIPYGKTITADGLRRDLVSMRDSDYFVFDTGGDSGLQASGSSVADAKITSSDAKQLFFVVCGDAAAAPAKYRICTASSDVSEKLTSCKP